MKIEVDYHRCTGHGFCEGIDEEIFRVRSDGVVEVVVDYPLDDQQRERVDEAVTLCPTRALSVIE